MRGWGVKGATYNCGMHTTRTPLLASVLLALLVGLLACDSPAQPTAEVTAIPTISPTVIASPPPTSTSTPPETLVQAQATATSVPSNQLSIAVADIPSDLPTYDRGEWRHWTDEDRDCQNTRQEVLVAESMVEVVFRSESECTVTEGEWFAAYTGTTVTDPGDLDVDHLVPLANAHRSGGWAWSPEEKRDYANSLDDPDHLIAVTAGANRSKGAKGPEEWRPSDESYWCEYATDWIRVKQAWGLFATPAEAAALQEMLAACVEDIGLTITEDEAPILIPSATATPVPKPTPTVPPTSTSEPEPTRTPLSNRTVYASCDEAEEAGEERIRGNSGPGMGFPTWMVPSARDGDSDGVVCEK